MTINKLTVERYNSPLLTEKYIFNFKEKTIIKSSKNSLGKTTLIRFILHALCFRIPSTRNFNFKEYMTQIVFTNKKGCFSAVRIKDSVVIYSDDKRMFEYNLGKLSDIDAALMFIFDIDNPKLIKQLLGCMYIDQDVGWVISNHGIILQYNRFVVLDIIASLADDSLAGIDSQIADVSRDINKYQSLYHLISQEKRENDVNLMKTDSLFYSTYRDLKEKKSMLLSKKNNIKSSVMRLENMLKNNEELASYIEQYKIYVKYGKEEPFLLTQSHLYNFDINKSLLINQLNEKKVRLVEIDKQIADINIQIKKNSPELSAKEISDNAISMIQRSDLEPTKVKSILDELKTELSSLKKRRESITKRNNVLYVELHSEIMKIISDLGHKSAVDKFDLLTLNAKRLFSGVELSDICFAYTFACLHFINRRFNINLPFIVDSPGSGERKIENLESLLDYIISNLGDSQLILSTTIEVPDEIMDWHISADGYIFEGHYKEY